MYRRELSLELGGGAASGAGVRADDGDWVIDTAWRLDAAAVQTREGKLGTPCLKSIKVKRLYSILYTMRLCFDCPRIHTFSSTKK